MISVYLRLAGTTYIHREEFPETPKSLSKLESCTPHHSTWAPPTQCREQSPVCFLGGPGKILSGKKGVHFLFGYFTSFFSALSVDWLQLLGRKRQDSVRALSVVSLLQRAQSLRWPCVTGLRYSSARLAWQPFSPAFFLLPFWTVPRAAKTRWLSFHKWANHSTAHTSLSSASPHSWWDWRDTRASRQGLPKYRAALMCIFLTN